MMKNMYLYPPYPKSISAVVKDERLYIVIYRDTPNFQYMMKERGVTLLK